MPDSREPVETPPQEARPPVFELAVSRDEIYADARPGAPVQPADPPPPPPPETAADPAPPTSLDNAPFAAPGLFVVRRRRTAWERMCGHPVLWPSAGAVVALLAGFLAALWIASSSLHSDVQPVVTSRSILEHAPPPLRDNEKIAQLSTRIQDERTSIAWKTGIVWTLAFAGVFWGWNRIFREK